jgi:hypothetical protein
MAMKKLLLSVLLLTVVMLIPRYADAVSAIARWNDPTAVFGVPTIPPDGTLDPITSFTVWSCSGVCAVTASWASESVVAPVDACPVDGFPHPNDPAAEPRDCGVVFPKVAGPPGVPSTWSFYMTSETVSGRRSDPSPILQAVGIESDTPLVPPQDFELDFAMARAPAIEIGIRRNGSLRYIKGEPIPFGQRAVLIIRDDKTARRWLRQQGVAVPQ